MHIRDYHPDDLEACRELWRDLTQRHRDIYEDPTIGGDDPGPYFDAEYLAHPHFRRAWVAERDGELIGLTGLFVDGEEAELEPIVVRPSERGRGVGSALAQHVIAHARTLGVRYINVRPVGRNVDAIRFFQREGFRLLGRIELSIPLADGAELANRGEVDVHGVRFEF